MFMAIGLMSLALQGTSHCKPCCGLYPCLRQMGMIGTELIGGILVGVSFLINRYMRKNLTCWFSAWFTDGHLRLSCDEWRDSF